MRRCYRTLCQNRTLSVQYMLSPEPRKALLALCKSAQVLALNKREPERSKQALFRSPWRRFGYNRHKRGPQGHVRAQCRNGLGHKGSYRNRPKYPHNCRYYEPRRHDGHRFRTDKVCNLIPHHKARPRNCFHRFHKRGRLRNGYRGRQRKLKGLVL